MGRGPTTGDDDFDYDAIQLDTADHIWIDHNKLTRMNDGEPPPWWGHLEILGVSTAAEVRCAVAAGG